MEFCPLRKHRTGGGESKRLPIGGAFYHRRSYVRKTVAGFAFYFLPGKSRMEIPDNPRSSYSARPRITNFFACILHWTGVPSPPRRVPSQNQVFRLLLLATALLTLVERSGNSHVRVTHGAPTEYVSTRS
jgi:hypothetical protein